MELLSIRIGAGQTRRFEKAGRYFEIIDSSSAVTVDFYSISGRQTDEMKNAVSGLFVEAEYGAFTIESAAAQTVTVLILENGRGGSRRQPGIVRVVDTAKQTTQDGQAFQGGTTTGTPAAGQFGTAQIVNPVGSGKRVIIERIEMGSAVQTTAIGGITQTQHGVSSSFVKPKLSGGAESAASFASKFDHVSDPGLLIPSPAFFGYVIPAGSVREAKPIRPYIIMPGFQFTVGNRVPSTALDVAFEFYEELI